MNDVRPLHRRTAGGVRAFCVLALVVACCSGTAVAAGYSSSHTTRQSNLSGKWHGHYSGAFTGKFTLHWRQTKSKLSGTIQLSKPKGKYGISGSVRRGGKIKFGAVGVGATYKGTVKGKTMSGTWNSPQGGGSWSARKVT